MSNWKFNLNFLKNKAFSKIKDFNKMDDSMLSDNYSIHFEKVLSLLSSNVRKSKGILILYTEVDYLRKILLTENGYIKKKFYPLMISYVKVLSLLDDHIVDTNANLSKEFYNKLVEFFYLLSSEIHDFENGTVRKLEDSSVKTFKELKGLESLDAELNKVILIKNRSERESELSKWFLEGKGPDLSNLQVPKSVEEVLSEINDLREGKGLNIDVTISDIDIDNNKSIVFDYKKTADLKINSLMDSLDNDKISSEYDIIDKLIIELENPNLSDVERRRLNESLERNKKFRSLIENDLDNDNK